MRTLSTLQPCPPSLAQTEPSKKAISWRLTIPLCIAALLLIPSTRAIIAQVLTDTIFQVSAFVAATLLLYHQFSSRFPSLELSYLQQHSPRLEVLTAALLGVLPGCGGAIVVVTQFTKGRASFGAVISVLIATMGDGAFLLLASESLTALGLMALSLLIGFACGLAVNACFKLTPSAKATTLLAHAPQKTISNRFAAMAWKLGLGPILTVALLLALNTSLDTLSPVIEILGIVFGLLAVICWAISTSNNDECCQSDSTQPSSSTFLLVAKETNFISVWVILSFLTFELLQLGLGIDLKAWFADHAIYAPLFAAAIGLIPGCGPQIVVITLYIQGALPFSALLANAISNDGDALFPALALAPKAATIASMLTTVPALTFGYLVYYVFER
jgi:hypothetical protein